ncbi:MAG: hypothetical protein AAB436_02540 [Patescibacteria group bacterium]
MYKQSPTETFPRVDATLLQDMRILELLKPTPKEEKMTWGGPDTKMFNNIGAIFVEAAFIAMPTPQAANRKPSPEFVPSSIEELTAADRGVPELEELPKIWSPQHSLIVEFARPLNRPKLFLRDKAQFTKTYSLKQQESGLFAIRARMEPKEMSVGMSALTAALIESSMQADPELLQHIGLEGVSETPQR